MTPEQLAAIAGILLSILFEYVPGLHAWYNALDNTRQRLFMLGLMVVVGAGAFGLSCSGGWAFVTCDKPGVIGLFNALVAAIVANQAAYLISPKARAETAPEQAIL